MKRLTLCLLPVAFLIVFSATLFADPVTDAADLIKHRQYDSTITLTTEAIKKDPSYAELYFLRGKAYYLKGDYENARTEFQNCLDRKRNHEDAKAYLALADIELKKFDEAKKILDEGAARSKNRKGLFLDALGKYYMAQGNLNDADLSFRRALIEEPDNLDYERDLADLNFENKVYAVAIQGYQKILAIDSTDVLTHYRLGRALYFQQKWSDALKSLNTAIRLDSSYTDAYSMSGAIYMILGLAAMNANNGEIGEMNSQSTEMFKNAIWMYEHYLKQGGKETLDVDYRLGQAYYNLNGFQAAADYLDKAIATGEAKENAYALKAKALFRLRQYDNAEAAFTDYENKLTGGNPNYQWSSANFDYFKERAQTYFQLYFEGRREGSTDSTLLAKAIPYYQKAIDVRDTTTTIDTGLYDQLGLCYYYLGQYADAIPWFEKKVSIDTVAIKSYQNLGNCYMKLDQPEKAMTYFDKVLQLNPNACSIYIAMFSYYLSEKKDRKAAGDIAQKWADCDTVNYQPYKWLGFFALTEKPARKEKALEYLMKAWNRSQNQGIDPCKDKDLIIWIAQCHVMWENDDAHIKQAVDWAKRGLKCDPNNETLKNIIKDNE